MSGPLSGIGRVSADAALWALLWRHTEVYPACPLERESVRRVGHRTFWAACPERTDRCGTDESDTDQHTDSIRSFSSDNEQSNPRTHCDPGEIEAKREIEPDFRTHVRLRTALVEADAAIGAVVRPRSEQSEGHLERYRLTDACRALWTSREPLKAHDGSAEHNEAEKEEHEIRHVRAGLECQAHADSAYHPAHGGDCSKRSDPPLDSISDGLFHDCQG